MIPLKNFDPLVFNFENPHPRHTLEGMIRGLRGMGNTTGGILSDLSSAFILAPDGMIYLLGVVNGELCLYKTRTRSKVSLTSDDVTRAWMLHPDKCFYRSTYNLLNKSRHVVGAEAISPGDEPVWFVEAKLRELFVHYRS